MDYISVLLWRGVLCVGQPRTVDSTQANNVAGDCEIAGAEAH